MLSRQCNGALTVAIVASAIEQLPDTQVAGYTSYSTSRRTKLGRQQLPIGNTQLYYITSRQLHYIFVCVCVFSNCKLPTQQLHYITLITRKFGLFLVV